MHKTCISHTDRSGQQARAFTCFWLPRRCRLLLPLLSFSALLDSLDFAHLPLICLSTNSNDTFSHCYLLNGPFFLTHTDSPHTTGSPTRRNITQPSPSAGLLTCSPVILVQVISWPLSSSRWLCCPPFCRQAQLVHHTLGQSATPLCIAQSQQRQQTPSSSSSSSSCAR